MPAFLGFTCSAGFPPQRAIASCRSGLGSGVFSASLRPHMASSGTSPKLAKLKMWKLDVLYSVEKHDLRGCGTSCVSYCRAPQF